MKRVRFYNVLGLLCNIAIMALFTLSCVKIMQYQGEVSYNGFARYDVLASMISVVAATLMIIANIVSIKRGKTSIPRLFSFLLFFAAAFSAIALIMNICLPSYNGMTSFKDLFSTDGGNLYFAFLIPVLVILNFLFISIDKQLKFPAVFFPFCGTLIYVLTILVMTVVTKKDISGYPMFHVLPELIKDGEDLSKNIIILVLFIVCSFGLSVAMWIINRINHAIIFGVSIKEVEQHNEKKPVEAKTTQVKNYFKNAVKFNYDENSGTVYHISYHNRKLKTWKVKAEEAGRALKVFKTQKEAIEYAKFMVAKNGGSIRIHSMIGRIRKDW